RVGRREIDGRAVSTRPLDLERARAFPHLDDAVDALLPRRPRDGLRVVAGRPRYDTAPLLVLGQSEDPVDRAAGLERARLLQELGLEPDAAGGVGLERRRPEDAAGDPCVRRLDVEPRGS